MSRPIPIIDIFSGPGGLGEGFASHRGRFEISIAAERDPAAHRTLLLRAFFRLLTAKERRELYYPNIVALSKGFDESSFTMSKGVRAKWEVANREARCLEVGNSNDDAVIADVGSRLARSSEPWVLIGGPPCQAYSLAGRVRNKAKKGYDPLHDDRVFLFRHYVRIVNEFGPAAFVMENVRGLLSSEAGGDKIFGMILELMRSAKFDGHRYELFSLEPDSSRLESLDTDFLIHSQHYGVPQSRARVIILGVREDVLREKGAPGALRMNKDTASLRSAFAGLPKLRSTLSKGPEKTDPQRWIAEVERQFRVASKACNKVGMADVGRRLGELACHRGRNRLKYDGAKLKIDHERMQSEAIDLGMSLKLRRWLFDKHLEVMPNHYARGHMASDLARYGFAAVHRTVRGKSPTSSEFPPGLEPNHKNWATGSFADRFSVQLPDRPASTITSHISKDGHKYIHWDPVQCRSFTVREAARAQSFPDNYVFVGSRTEQYVQVGNAVPPYLAMQIAKIVENLLS